MYAEDSCINGKDELVSMVAVENASWDLANIWLENQKEKQGNVLMTFNDLLLVIYSMQYACLCKYGMHVQLCGMHDGDN